MCARLGIRLAYSQAYRPQANGRAEVAGKTIKNLLRKFEADQHPTPINWVEVLPRILYGYHNLPNETGLSPYQIVFGRERTELGLPLHPLNECEDATLFFDRMELLDSGISNQLNILHKSRSDQVNKTRHHRKPFEEGDAVWYSKPKQVGGFKLDTRWYGPCKVMGRRGESSYVIEVKPGIPQEVHLDQLKPHFHDYRSGGPTVYFQFQAGYKPEGLTSGDGWVKNILNHRERASGELECLVQYQGAPASDSIWKLLGNLLLLPGSALQDYLSAHRIVIPEP